MNKFLLIILLLPTIGFTQYNSYKVGARAGLNYSDTNAGGFEYPKVGLHAGGFITGVVNSSLQVSSEIMYSYQGANYDVEDAKDITYKNNLITTSVMVRYFVLPKFNLHSGIQLGFMLKQKVGEYEVSPVSNTEDVSLLVGMGYSINDSVEIATRYSHGLAQIENRVLQLSVLVTAFKF